VTIWPLVNCDVASPQPTTAGMPYSLAMIEAWGQALPTLVTSAEARRSRVSVRWSHQHVPRH
jgi:hypothetical protein